MAFFKTGDVKPIINIITPNGTIKCDKCGKEINTIKVDDKQNEITCECEMGDNDD